MSTFDEAKHPRGQVKNKGQFTKSAQFGANGQARDWAVRLMNRMGGHSEVPTMEVNARTGKADRPILQGDLFPRRNAVEAHLNVDAIKGKLTMIKRLAGTATREKLLEYVNYVQRANQQVASNVTGAWTGGPEDMRFDHPTKAERASDEQVAIAQKSRAATGAVLARLASDMQQRALGNLEQTGRRIPLREMEADWQRFEDVAKSDRMLGRIIEIPEQGTKGGETFGSRHLDQRHPYDRDRIQRIGDRNRGSALVASFARSYRQASEAREAIHQGADRDERLDNVITHHAHRARELSDVFAPPRPQGVLLVSVGKDVDDALREQSRREQDAADRKYEARANLSRLDSIKKDAATLPHPSFAPVQDAVKKALASDPREEVREGHVVIIANEGTVFDSTKDFHFRVRIYSKDGATIGEMSRTSHSATKEIHNNVFQMKDAFQGGGLAFHLQEHLFDAYRKAGYELVTVDAAGTRRDQIKATGGDYCGNIAWAAMGFTWKDKAMRDEMRDQFHGWLRDNRRVYQKFEESAYANGRSIEEHLDAIVKHPWTLTRFKVDGVEGEQAQAGKLFLAQSGQWWKGKFSLKPRSVSSRQFEAALEAKKKAASSKAEAS